MNQEEFQNQVILVDKAKGFTSFEVVKRLQRISRMKKVGHAGTLDPLATGLLILCTGEKTKEISTFQEWEKEYIVEFELGGTTPTYDAEFAPENIKKTGHITEKMLVETIQTFVGEIQQLPPVYSAVKIEGKRSYELARKGIEVELKTRKVLVKEFELVSFQNPIGKARIVCSKGTYVRSLIHDLGQKLGVGAYVKELRRTRIGEYRIENAIKLDELELKK